MFRDLLVT